MAGGNVEHVYSMLTLLLWSEGWDDARILAMMVHSQASRDQHVRARPRQLILILRCPLRSPLPPRAFAAMRTRQPSALPLQR